MISSMYFLLYSGSNIPVILSLFSDLEVRYLDVLNIELLEIAPLSVGEEFSPVILSEFCTVVPVE